MATLEMELDPSKRDFLTLEFARRKSHGGQPSGRLRREAPLSQPEPPERSGLRLTRRQLIIGGTVATGSAIATLLKPWDWLIPHPELTIKYQEVKLYYPQIKDYPVFNHGEFTTGNTHTKWFNLTRADFNPQLATIVFKFFEDLGQGQKLINYSYDQRSVPFALDRKPRTERVVFLVPQTAPSPGWPDIAHNATTTGRFTDGPYVTFVRVLNTKKDLPPSQVFTSAELAANKAFAVEACQSSLRIFSLTPEVAHLVGQEIICNSWGIAFTLKQNGMPFEDYQTWAKDTQIRKDPNSPSFSVYVLNENEYAGIPTVGVVISKR